MILTADQINELLSIINTNQAILVGSQLGISYLSEYDKALLTNSGIDWENLYDPSLDSIYQSFHLGMLAQALKDTSAIKKLTYNQVKEYIKQGQYIPITQREQATLTAIKNQTLSDIKRKGSDIFQDINGILNNKSQEQYLKDEIEEGIRKKNTIRHIANEIHRKTGDWSRDFDRIVEFQANSAYQEGRAIMAEKDGGKDVEVYKRVFASACKHCISLYLTGGFGSEPKIFKLSELKANGTNIGRKTAEWKPVIGSTHPFCRCLLMIKPQGYKWNSETQAFDILDKETPRLKVERKPIRVKIAGREIQV